MITVPEILPDGTLLVDLQDAIQAAWIAGERTVAAELTQRYDLHRVLCLCCATPSLSVYARYGERSVESLPLLVRLCAPCLHEALPVKPMIFVDGPGWTRPMQAECRTDLKPLLDNLKSKLTKLPPVAFKFTTFKAK